MHSLSARRLNASGIAARDPLPLAIAVLSFLVIASCYAWRSGSVGGGGPQTSAGGASSADGPVGRGRDGSNGEAADRAPARTMQLQTGTTAPETARELAAEAVKRARTGWLAGGLSETEIEALRHPAETTLETLMTGDYEKYKAMRQSQGASLSEAANRFVKREAKAKQYRDLDVAGAMTKPLDGQVEFFWTNVRARNADWQSVDLESAQGGTGRGAPHAGSSQFLLGQGSLFSMPEEARLQREYRSGAAKVAWVEVPVRLGPSPHACPVRVAFCQAPQTGIWFPIWLFALPETGEFPKLML